MQVNIAAIPERIVFSERFASGLRMAKMRIAGEDPAPE
jgi:hypothetical protein